MYSSSSLLGIWPCVNIKQADSINWVFLVKNSGVMVSIVTGVCSNVSIVTGDCQW